MLEDSEITVLLMAACGAGAFFDQGGWAFPGEVRLRHYGIHRDPYAAARKTLEWFALLDVEEIMRHSDGAPSTTYVVSTASRSAGKGSTNRRSLRFSRQSSDSSAAAPDLSWPRDLRGRRLAGGRSSRTSGCGPGKRAQKYVDRSNRRRASLPTLARAASRSTGPSGQQDQD
ncbi:hypothetical protein ACIO3S_24485 [Nocardioides sp. NPDC087217]|uniref:hypothetical protein n=1 Tax=Nocardioides sp. NPDC087217 TaxID=3364335 RepID=UPI00381FB1F7